MRETAIGLMAKYPRSGKVKTRLAAGIGTTAALQVYRELLQHTCDVMGRLAPQRFLRAAFVTPADQVKNFESRYGPFDTYSAQVDGDLGCRMHSAFSQLLSLTGIRNAMLIGADCPELSLELIGSVPALLKRNDLVLGPTHDGGYYLIALKAVQEGLFTGIPWSTETVFRETVAAAGATNLKVASLPTLRDLDDSDDLQYFVRRGLLKARKVT